MARLLHYIIDETLLVMKMNNYSDQVATEKFYTKHLQLELKKAANKLHKIKAITNHHPTTSTPRSAGVACAAWCWIRRP